MAVALSQMTSTSVGGPGSALSPSRPPRASLTRPGATDDSNVTMVTAAAAAA